MNASPFDPVAGTYDDVATSELGRVLRDRVHAALAPHVGSGVRMLDLGCGTGIDAAWAADRGAIVTAVDASDGMVEQARDRVGDRARVARLDLDDDDWSVAGGPFENF